MAGSSPRVADWNGDGKKDLVVGEFNGHVRVYLNVNTDEDPVFLSYSLVEVNSLVFSAGVDSMPHVVDWDNDGRKDLLCGGGAGKVYLLINEGTASEPLFNTADFVKDGSADLFAGSRSSPSVADLNRDGRKDLVVGNYGGTIYYYENKGTDAAPVFNGHVLLETRHQPIDVGSGSRMDTFDWDNDGITDVLSGDLNGLVHFFQGIGPLLLSDNGIHAGTGGVVDFSLDAGGQNQGRGYLLLGSVTGTEPGILLPGGQVTLPLNWDPFTNLVIDLLNTTVFQDFMGTLDSEGQGSARFDTLGPVPGASGMVISFAYALNQPWDFASNGANVEIVP